MDTLKDYFISWGWAGAIIAQLIVAWVGLTLRRSFVLRREYDADRSADKAVLEVDRTRVTRLENEMKHRPTFKDLQAFQVQMSELMAAVQATTAMGESQTEALRKVTTQLNMLLDASMAKKGSSQ